MKTATGVTPVASTLGSSVFSNLDSNGYIGAQAQLRLGALYLHLDHPGQALARYLAALQLDPALPEAGAGAGLAHLRLGDPQAAERRLRRSLTLRFNAPAIHQVLGELLNAIGRSEEASQFLRLAAEQRTTAGQNSAASR